MNDDRLKSLYRRMTSGAPAPVAADDLADAVSRSGYPDCEHTPLDRIATSASQADLLRVALALAPDAQQLSRDITALRAPKRSAVLSRWVALAAGVGAIAVLVSGLRVAQVPDGAAAAGFAGATADTIPDEILSASFEASAQTASNDEVQPLFSGGFDS